MQIITLEEHAQVLELGTVEQTITLPSSLALVVNTGTESSPCRYIITNDDTGMSAITPDFFVR